MNVTDDGQTDHTNEKCVTIGRIASARAIPPNNYMKTPLLSVLVYYTSTGFIFGLMGTL